MKLIWLEGKRIVQKRWVLLCFVSFLVLGIWISELMLERSYQKAGCSVEQYLEVVESIDGMALTDAAKYLDEKVKAAFEAVETYQSYRMGRLNFEETVQRLAALGYGEISPDELTFGELWAERVKYQTVLEEVHTLLQYEDRIKEVQQGTGGLSDISFFSADDYVMRTKEKAMRDYANLSVKLDTWQSNVSSREFLQNRMMDGLIFLFLIVVVLLLYMEEKEKGYVTLTAATQGGRQQFYLRKTGVLFGLTLFTVSVYDGMLLLYYVLRLGGIAWNAPIQSLAVFEMCSHGITVGTALVLTVFFKILIFYILALLMAAIACMMPKSMPFLCTVITLALLSVVWNQTANMNDRMGWLSCLNPVRMTDAAGFITQYRQLPVFQKPISEGRLTGVFVVWIAVFSYAVGIGFYARVRKRKGASFLLKDPGNKEKTHKKWKVPIKEKQMTKNAFFREMKKIMISYIMLVPVLLVVLACMIGYYMSDGMILTQQEQFYREYMIELNGPLTVEKEQFLSKEREQFRNLEVFRDELLMHGEDQGLLLSYIENELIKKSAFDLVEQQYIRIQEQGGVFLYETGYLYLLGIEENESGRVAVFLSILFLTLFLPALSWIELGGGADGLIRTTVRGRSRLLGMQYLVYFVIAAALFGCVCVEDMAKIFEQFGNYGLVQAAGNISRLDGFLSGCNVGVCLIFVYAIRLFGVALVTLFVMACMYRCRDYLSTVFLCGAFFVIPYVLFMKGFSFMKGYFVNAFLLGEEFLGLIRQGRTGMICLIILQVGLCIGWSLRVLRKEVKRR